MARARFAALALLAAIAGLAAAGLAALAEAGVHVCSHHAETGHEHVLAICPTVLYAAAVAGGLSLLALVVLAGSRAGAPAIVTATARLVAGIRVGPLTALIGTAGAVPVVAILASEGLPSGPLTLLVFAALLVGAFLTALSLAGVARVVLAAAERLVVALARAFRLLAPGADAPWLPQYRPVLVSAGARLVSRRPSRAPPPRY